MITLNIQKHLLIVEDCQSQLELIKEALNYASKSYKLHSVHNGEEALNFLYRKHHYHQAPRPDVIILDLNLPRINGTELLTKIKGDFHLKTIPIVVFTTSDCPADILKTYRLQANSYVVKPHDVEQFFTFVQAIENFWLRIATLPIS